MPIQVKKLPSEKRKAQAQKINEPDWEEIFNGERWKFTAREQKPNPQKFKIMIRNRAWARGYSTHIEEENGAIYVQATKKVTDA